MRAYNSPAAVFLAYRTGMSFGNNQFVSLNAEQKHIPAWHFSFCVTDGKNRLQC